MIAIVLSIVFLILLFSVLDAVAFSDKIYRGISVEGTNIGGMTKEEAQSALEDAWSAEAEGKTVIVRASTADDAQTWNISSDMIIASIDSTSIVDEAMKIGHGTDFFAGRLRALFGGIQLQATMLYNDSLFSSVVSMIDDAIGSPLTNSSVIIDSGNISVSASSKGYLLDQDEFLDELAHAFLSDANSFVAPMKETDPQIAEEQAQACASTIEQAISTPVTLTYQDSSWTLDSATLGTLISTRIDSQTTGKDTSYVLTPYIDATTASQTLSNNVLGAGVVVNPTDAHFDVSSGEPVLVESQIGSGPDVTAGMQKLQDLLFGSSSDGSDSSRTIALDEMQVQPTITTQMAQTYGVVEKINEYTTEFYQSSEADGARIHNIQLLASMLSYVMIAPDAVWSLNDYVGECDAAKGFETAGIVVDGELEQAVGGGICQIATTIFNCAYECGLPIVQRTNHSRYIASYPDGRDAAVSYPDLDLKFGNDTGYYLLMVLTYGDTWVTCTIYGTDPHYTVTSDVGAWVDGTPYTTKTVEDPTKPTGYSEVTTQGKNAKSITVVRHVFATDGTEVRTDTFVSNYNAVQEVITVGTGPATTTSATATPATTTDATTTDATATDTTTTDATADTATTDQATGDTTDAETDTTGTG